MSNRTGRTSDEPLATRPARRGMPAVARLVRWGLAAVGYVFATIAIVDATTDSPAEHWFDVAGNVRAGIEFDRGSTTLIVARWASFRDWDDAAYDWRKHPFAARRFAGFSWIGGVATRSGAGGVRDKAIMRGVGLPTAFLAIACLAPLGWATFVRVRATRRRKSSACVACGYDLRASPDRCPECGTPNPWRR